MARIDSPNALMYTKLKSWGISNRDAATILLNTELTFDGRTLRSRIEESSQLSRRIVHTQPGEIPLTLFNNFQVTCPQLVDRMVSRLAVVRYAGDKTQAATQLQAELVGTCSAQMATALQETGGDGALYRNMLSYLQHVDLPREDDRLVLHLMLFVISGCTGSARTASNLVNDHATTALGADFHTSETIFAETAQPPEMDVDLGLGFVRIKDGRIEAGSQMHVLDPAGTEIGLLPSSLHTVTDVGPDASRHHARVWREGGIWYLCDLGSTNGTYLVSGADGTELPVGPDPVALATSDIVCLGATTRFIVMPVIGQ